MTTLPIVLDKGGPQHRAWQAVGYGLLVGLAVYVAVSQPTFQLTNATKVCGFSVAVLGLNLVTGFNGQVSLGHSAFFGVGAYTTAVLFQDYDWPFLATLPASAALGAVLGFVVGLPALRLKGLYLALVTLALGFSFPVLLKLNALEGLTNGANGKPVTFDWVKPRWFTLDVTDAGWRFLVAACIAGACFWLASNMVRSRVGRAIQALRDNPVGAAVAGVYPAAWKTGAFSVSAAFAALGGSVFIFAVGIVSPDSVGFIVAIQLITGLVLGGAGTISGSFLGGLALVYLPFYTSRFTSDVSFAFVDPTDSGLLANVLYGVLLIAVVFVMPGGVVSFLRLVRSKLVRFVPRLPTVSSSSDDKPRRTHVASSGSQPAPGGEAP